MIKFDPTTIEMINHFIPTEMRESHEEALAKLPAFVQAQVRGQSLGPFAGTIGHVANCEQCQRDYATLVAAVEAKKRAAKRKLITPLVQAVFPDAVSHEEAFAQMPSLLEVVFSGLPLIGFGPVFAHIITCTECSELYHDLKELQAADDAHLLTLPPGHSVPPGNYDFLSSEDKEGDAE